MIGMYVNFDLLVISLLNDVDGYDSSYDGFGMFWQCNAIQLMEY